MRLRSGLVHAGLESGVATGLVLRLAFGSGPMQAIERLEALASLARGSGRDAPHPVDREPRPATQGGGGNGIHLTDLAIHLTSRPWTPENSGIRR